MFCNFTIFFMYNGGFTMKKLSIFLLVMLAIMSQDTVYSMRKSAAPAARPGSAAAPDDDHDGLTLLEQYTIQNEDGGLSCIFCTEDEYTSTDKSEMMKHIMGCLEEHRNKEEGLETSDSNYDDDNDDDGHDVSDSKSDDSDNKEAKASKKFICDHPDCGLELGSVSGLDWHKKKHKQGLPQCTTCKSVFQNNTSPKSIATFALHTKNCDGISRYKKLFQKTVIEKDIDDLVKKYLKKLAPKSFCCTYEGCKRNAERPFPSRSNTKRHIQIHLGHVPPDYQKISCPYCNTNTKISRNQFSSHMKDMHPDKLKKPVEPTASRKRKHVEAVNTPAIAVATAAPAPSAPAGDSKRAMPATPDLPKPIAKRARTEP